MVHHTGKSPRDHSCVGRSNSNRRNAGVHNSHQKPSDDNREAKVKHTSTDRMTRNQVTSTDDLSEHSSVGCFNISCVRKTPKKLTYTLGSSLETKRRLQEPLASKSNDGHRSTAGRKPSTYSQVCEQATNRGFPPRVVTGSGTSDHSAPAKIAEEKYNANKYG